MVRVRTGGRSVCCTRRGEHTSEGERERIANSDNEREEENKIEHAASRCAFAGICDGKVCLHLARIVRYLF